MNRVAFLFFLSFSMKTFSHGGVDHRKSKKDSSLESKVTSTKKKNALKNINLQYQIKIKKIFKRSCFDCHSTQTKYPWYYKIPGIKQLIDKDIHNARKHLDFSNGFPFIGHESPENDLKSIYKSIENNTMPPLKYKIMHPSSGLNPKEKRK